MASASSWTGAPDVFLLVDLDGVVYRGATPVPGVAELLSQRVRYGDVVMYVTNNSRSHRTEHMTRLIAIGAPVTAECIVSAAWMTAHVLAASPAPPRCSMVFGSAGLTRELREVGLSTVPVTQRGLAAEPDAVIVGAGLALTAGRLGIAAEAVRGGARFVAINLDAKRPDENGSTAAAGAMVVALSEASGREPDLVVGKPNPMLLYEAAALAGRSLEDAIVIGDGISSDIGAAKAVGARSVLMLTGISSRSDVESLPTGAFPTAVAADSAQLERILGRLATRPH